MGAADLWHRYIADGNKFRHHYSQNAGTGNGLHAHAGVLLDRARFEPDDCRGLSDPDCHIRDDAAGPVPRLPLLFGRCRGQPEVYILVLPAFGVFSEVSATFSGKPLFGYRSMVAATMAICVLSLMVWLHHFFTMGASPAINGFFGIMSMIIGIPTGVKIFNWLFT